MKLSKMVAACAITVIAAGCMPQSTPQPIQSTAANIAIQTNTASPEPTGIPTELMPPTNTSEPPSIELEQLDPGFTTSDETMIWHLTNNHIFEASYSLDGQSMALLTAVGVVIYDVNTMKSTAVMKDIRNDTTTLAWSPNGEWLAGGTKDGLVRLWEPSTGEIVTELDDGSVSIYGIVWSPDAKYLAVVPGNRTMRIWDVTSQEVTRAIETPVIRPVDLAWSPDGRWLATEHADGHARVFDTSTWQEVVDFSPPAEKAISGFRGFTIAWATDSSWVASGAQEGSITLWKPATGEISLIDDYDADVTSIASSPDSKYLASGDLNSVIEIWEVTTGDRVGTLPMRGLEGGISSISWSPDGKYIIATFYRRELVRWNVLDEIK